MGGQFAFVLFCLLLGTCHVGTFTISSRKERSTDLAEALAILQRQRRRATSDYLGPDRLLNQGSFAAEDDGEWLRGSNDDNNVFRNEPGSDWATNAQFVDFDPQYDIPMDSSRLSAPVYVEPSRQELENIFDAEDDDDNTSSPKLVPASLPEKKKKEEMLNVKGDGKIVQKKSFSPEIPEAAVISSGKNSESNDGLSLDALTKEEFHALMKAVDKLQKQAVKFSEKTVETPDAKVTTVEAVKANGQPESLTIVQPASKEELKSVFEEDEDDEPVTKETEVIVERDPNSVGERVIKQQVVSNISSRKAKELKEKEIDLINVIASELEENIAANEDKDDGDNDDDLDIAGNGELAGVERDWLERKYQSPLHKRTTKRSVPYFQEPASDLYVEDIGNDVSSQSDDVIEDLDGAVIPASLERFVGKILQLQDEVDNLKIVSQLEDLENDVLTDALNEATLAQKEGSVTDMEFESLQQAIRIEEALQKLKNSQVDIKYPVDVIKRGEPWRRKRDPDYGSNVIVEDNLTPYSLIPSSAIVVKSNADADEDSLLDEPSARETNEQDADVASFFVSNAEECPGVQEYSTNCELADYYNLPVDFEARSLCNLHEMCYACGNSLKVGKDQCDLVYRAAASALCRGKQNCVLESEIFLRTMKLKNRYIPHAQPLCGSTCVAEFLGML